MTKTGGHRNLLKVYYGRVCVSTIVFGGTTQFAGRGQNKFDGTQRTIIKKKYIKIQKINKRNQRPIKISPNAIKLKRNPLIAMVLLSLM